MLQFISHHTERFSYLDSVRMALEGGCRWIQLRMKDATDEEVRPIALQCLELCRGCGADGVHLGKNDMPIAEARQLLGREFIIGGTANTFADVESHYRNSADYIGCGPFRFTTTKAKLSPILGLDGYREIVGRMRSAGINLPIVAIGGITASDIPSILSTGVSGIAISGEVLRAENPSLKMQEILKIIAHEQTNHCRP